MTTFVFANNVSTQLASPLASGATSMSLASATNLPSLSVGQQFPMTLKDAATGLYYEIVYVTAISGTTLTIIRGQEGTGDLNWSIGDYVFSNLTAGTAQTFAQAGQIQAGALNYAVDTGAVNALTVSLSPAPTALTDGMVVRFKANHTNTGAATLALNGLASTPITAAGGTALAGGEIVVGYDYQVIYSSGASSWLLMGQTAGQVIVPTATLGGAAVNLTQLNAAIPAAFTSGGSTTLTLPASGSAPGTVGSSGWRKAPDGTITQWAAITLRDDGTNVTTTWTFPIAFTVGPTSITAQLADLAAGGTSYNSIASVKVAPTTTSVGFSVRNSTTIGNYVFIVEAEGK